MKTWSITAAAAFAAAAVFADESEAEEPDMFDFGADLRIRQELMDNVPGLPGGGLLLRAPRSGYRNHVRFRPRVWGEFTPDDNWRLYMRIADEFRWNVRPKSHKTTFPDEAVIDNLFLEAKDLFDDFLDFSIGRQDLYNLYGLDHIFVDGTPGDGSRTVFTDMVRVALKFPEVGKVDLFALHNWDDNPLRWGTRRSKHRSISGLGGGAEVEMDDWGWGAIWTGETFDWLPYQVFAMQKLTSSFHRGGEKHPSTRRELFGAKLMPKLTETLSLQFEGMGQVGRNGDDDWLSGWSAYAGVNWRDASAFNDFNWTPFAKVGLHVMSGDKDAADEDGGHHAWDPMWSRGVNDSEMFLYGTHYGAAWWSNMMFLKLSAGMEFSRKHCIVASTGPMFAETQDHMGGGDGTYKGLLSQVRYDFPILLADKDAGRRFEIFGHFLAELFNPGDYFSTDRPGWFFRWQVELKF